MPNASNFSSRSKLASLPCSLPLIDIPDDCDHNAVAREFGRHLSTLSIEHFEKDAIWRDSFALTGTLRTFYSSETIIRAWRETCQTHGAHSFTATPKSSHIMRMPGGYSWIDAWFEFQTKEPLAASCSLFVSLVPCESGKYRIWVLGTVLEQFLGQPNCDMLEPKSMTNADKEDEAESDGRRDGTYFDCIVVGGGQAGLGVGGRLQALGVSYAILEQNQRVGDNWKNRYTSARIHTTRQSAHLPFDRTFDASYQEFLTKDDLAKGYRDWAEKFGINVWLSTTLTSGSWDPESKLWQLCMLRNGEEKILTTSMVVLALGAGGQKPTMPEIPGREGYKGTVLHSVEYTSPSSEWKGRSGLVVGSANTAHDIAVDMVEAGLSSVTMVQRSPTYVVPYEYYTKEVQDKLYNEFVPIETADRLTQWSPFPVIRLMSMATLNSQAAQEPGRFDALERADFLTERYGDIINHLFERFGGHYMDVGASKMIADGLIKVKPGASITRYTENGLEFSDGSTFETDIIVFATGFESDMRQEVQRIFGQDVASQVDAFWGFDDEGELQGVTKPSGHPGLLMHGGTQSQARFWSRFIALRTKANVLGTPLPIYSKTPSK